VYTHDNRNSRRPIFWFTFKILKFYKYLVNSNFIFTINFKIIVCFNYIVIHFNDFLLNYGITIGGGNLNAFSILYIYNIWLYCSNEIGFGLKLVTGLTLVMIGGW
jgi:hypothetical protein